MLTFPPDQTFVVEILSFFVLLFVLHHWLFVPFHSVLLERKRRTEGAMAEAAAERAEAQRLAEQIQAELEATRAEAAREAEEIRRQTQQAQAALFEQAKNEAAGQLALLREQIVAEQEKAWQSLQSEAEMLGLQMVDAILGWDEQGKTA